MHVALHVHLTPNLAILKNLGMLNHTPKKYKNTVKIYKKINISQPKIRKIHQLFLKIILIKASCNLVGQEHFGYNLRTWIFPVLDFLQENVNSLYNLLPVVFNFSIFWKSSCLLIVVWKIIKFPVPCLSWNRLQRLTRTGMTAF